MVQNEQKNLPTIPNIGWILSLLLLSIGLVLCTVFNPTGIESESVSIHLDIERRLVARIYTPLTTSAPHPVMLLCHGVNNSKEVMLPIAVELARHGIAAIAFDFGGMGESYHRLSDLESIQNFDSSNLADARTVLAFVRSQPKRFDLNRIGIGGHSLGGTTALQLAQTDPQLRATIVLGMSGQVTPVSPANLFLGVGAYEQLNPASELRPMLQQATGSDRPPCINSTGEVCGNFATRTARQLVISPTADHVIEPYDPLLMRQVVNWAQRALDVPPPRRGGETPPSVSPPSVSPPLVSPPSYPPPKPLVVPWYILGRMVTFCGAIASGVCLFLRSGRLVVKPIVRQFYRGCVTWLIGVLMVVIWGLGSSGLGPTRGASTMLLFSYILQLSTNYALRYPEKVTSAVRVYLLYSLLFLGAFVLPALLSGTGEIVSNPAYVTSLPQFLLQWPVFMVYNYYQVFKLAFFPAYTLELVPSLLFLLLVLLELIWPGVTLTLLERVAVMCVRCLRQPFTFSGTGTISRKSAGLLGVLVLVLVAILYQRVRDGVFSVATSNGVLVLQLLLQMVFLPVVVILAGVRSPVFRYLERRLIQKLPLSVETLNF